MSKVEEIDPDALRREIILPSYSETLKAMPATGLPALLKGLSGEEIRKHLIDVLSEIVAKGRKGERRTGERRTDVTVSAEYVLWTVGRTLPMVKKTVRNSFERAMTDNPDLSGMAPVADQLTEEIMGWLYFGLLSALIAGHGAAEVKVEPQIPFMITGKQVKRGGEIGNEAAYGTAAEKEARWKNYQRTVDELRSENPNATWSVICHWAARRHKVSAKTIQRRCQDPRKKS